MLVPVMRGQDAAKLAERLQAADAGSALDASDVKPWHLKMTVQLFDEKGQSTDHGTIEEWWSAPGVDRREYKTDAYTATEIRNADKFYRTKDAGSPPYYLELLREQAVHPMPASSEVSQSKPEARQVPFGKVSLDCIMLAQPVIRFGVLPLGLFPTYCFDPGTDVPRASFEFGEQLVVRNAIYLFQGKTVARDVTVMSANVKAASSQIVSLEAASSPESDFELSDAVIEQKLGPVRTSSGVTQGYAIKQPAPIYPGSAKERHASGVVILHALIGTDGHIHSLQVISMADPDLALAAIDAVRKWVYKPYLLLGVPVDVETTINVNFTFN
jgi:TonB family protein